MLVAEPGEQLAIWTWSRGLRVCTSWQGARACLLLLTSLQWKRTHMQHAGDAVNSLLPCGMSSQSSLNSFTVIEGLSAYGLQDQKAQAFLGTLDR